MPNGTKTFGGLITAVVGAVLVFAGVEADVVSQITEDLQSGIGAVLAIVGVASVVYGRMVAKGPILKDKE